MHEQDLMAIKEKLMQELLTYKDVKKMEPPFAHEVKTLASAITKICMILDETGEGSSRRGMASRGWYEGSFEGGSRRGGSYEGGSYEGGSYDGGSSGRRGRNAMGRYTSREGGFREALEEAMAAAPSERDRRDIEDMLSRMR